jgi:lipid-binding SYLF domain-containing protein
MTTTMMTRRELILIGSTTLLAACSTSTGGTADPGAKRREIDAGVDNALAELYANAPGSRELAEKARGILVFPKVVSAGFVVGGSYGQGALRKGPDTAAYYSVGAGSVGLLAGAQSKAMYLFFMTQEALQKFEASNGWTAGADASVVIANVGANATIDTKTSQAPIIGFVRTNAGLMANLSLDGTKFNKLTTL